MNIMRAFTSIVTLFIYIASYGQELSATVIGENSNLVDGAICKIYAIPDSTLFSSTITDTIGYFISKYPVNLDWYLFITKNEYQPLVVKCGDVLKALEYKRPLVFKLEKTINNNIERLDLPEFIRELPDSLEDRELNEVIVVADRMFMTNTKVSYTPNKQQRNASANGTMLLQQLAIPQLSVNALTGTVSTNTGEAVSFFIDGVPATTEDVADINTRDVMRVEILDYPTDPKFRNAAHVVNYIMQKYEYGGYTKLSTTEMLLSCFSSYNTINSKMAYKKMTFDARAYYQYTNGSHYGTDQIQQFRLPGYENDAPNGITRINNLENSKYIANRPSASFRALYQGAKTQYSSTINWAYDGTIRDYRTGSLSYNPSLFDANTWTTNFPTRKSTIKWSNDFFQVLPQNWALSASFELAYNHVNQTQFRSESETVLQNLNAKENIWATQGEVSFSKEFNERHTLSINANTLTYKSDIKYRGSSVFDNHYSVSGVSSGVSYTFTPNDKLFARLDLGATYYHSDVSDETENKFYPSVNFNLGWMPRNGHRIQAFFNYSLEAPDGSQTNAVLTQTDMLKWSQGNPSLKSYNSAFTQLNYTWVITQYLSLSPTATWVYRHNYFADTYSLIDDGKGILVKPENCGNYHNIWGAINFAGYFFNRKLVVQAHPSIGYHKFTGIYDISYTSVGASLSATYYMGQFYVGANYTTPQTQYNQSDPVKFKTHSQYWFMAGWGNSAWMVSAFIINPFRSHWRGNIMMIDTPYYSMHNTTINVNEHRRINLTVAYTFGYGKKVQRGNDINGASDVKSSIR